MKTEIREHVERLRIEGLFSQHLAAVVGVDNYTLSQAAGSMTIPPTNFLYPLIVATDEQCQRALDGALKHLESIRNRT